MESIRWVDTTYLQKHKAENPETLRSLYYPSLSLYTHPSKSKDPSATSGALTKKALRFLKKGLISLAVYTLSFTPILGPLVLPAASFYTFKKSVGIGPASAIFAAGLLVPRAWLVVFLQTYFSSRSLMRELLEPYFSRVRFTPEQKRRWFRSRAGILFGFALGFNVLVRVPLVGVLVYGIAEASTAYLVTKITDPPPEPERAEEYAEGQMIWTNKQQFLDLGILDLDALESRVRRASSGLAGEKEKASQPPSYDEATLPAE